MRALEITESDLDGTWKSLRVVGEVDLATVDELTTAIQKVQTSDGLNLVVDLTGTGFMDSTGLKTLIVASREFGEAGREFAVAIKPGPIERLVELSGVGATMTIVGGVEEVTGGA